MDNEQPDSRPSLGLSPEMLERLQREPWLFGFMALLRRISANPDIDPVGTALRPGAEPFRLGQQPSLSFAPREIASAQERDDGRLLLKLFSLGMLGPNGPLPIHMTEIARERETNRNDSTLVDFLDIFHHRFMSLFHRAWASTQATAGLDRPGPATEEFSFYAGSLAGKDPELLDGLSLPAHAQLAASAHTVREMPNPDAICQTLSKFFNVPVEVEPFVFRWMDVPPEEISRLGVPGMASTMGGAVLGTVIPDRQHHFQINIGPLDLPQYQRFTPAGEDLPLLIDLVRMFVGKRLHWILELRLKTSSATPATIGGEQQLGWSTWLGENPAAGDYIVGMTFQPERDFVRKEAEGAV